MSAATAVDGVAAAVGPAAVGAVNQTSLCAVPPDWAPSADCSGSRVTWWATPLVSLCYYGNWSFTPKAFNYSLKDGDKPGASTVY